MSDRPSLEESLYANTASVFYYACRLLLMSFTKFLICGGNLNAPCERYACATRSAIIAQNTKLWAQGGKTRFSLTHNCFVYGSFKKEEYAVVASINEHCIATLLFPPIARVVCGSSILHDIIFFLLVSLLENKISLGACKPNYWLKEGLRCVTACAERLGQHLGLS